MKSRTTASFRKCLQTLPPEIRESARKAYKLFSQNPGHPSLRFKKVHATDPIYSARITGGYRAVCVLDKDTDGDQVAIWFFIGSHADFDKIV